MGRLGLTLFLLLMCEICTCTVQLNVRFLMDLQSNAFAVAPKVIWKHLMRSEILRGHLGSYTVADGSCNLNGAREMMKNLEANDVSKVHAFIGPICSYLCDVTGMISAAYIIPQVSTFNYFISLPRCGNGVLQ